jgi:hypothetical protein
MDAIVGLVAVIRLEVHGDCAIACHAEAVNQLLEIGTALFAVPPLELNGLGILTVVGAPDHDAGGVVVNLIHPQIKAVHDGQHDARLQGGAIRREQPIESAPELVVADLALRDQSRVVECGPFPNRIERVTLDQDVLQERQQRIGVARVLQSQRQLFLEPRALDEAVQNRQRAHTQSAQAQSFLLHGFS